MNTTTLHGIPNCDTVKRARAWLTGHGVAHQFHDFKKQGLPDALLDGWLQRLDWEMLLNRKGSTWRLLNEDTRAATTSAAVTRMLMLAQPSLVKRPVVAWADGRLTVGFDPDAWEQAVQAAQAK